MLLPTTDLSVSRKSPAWDSEGMTLRQRPLEVHPCSLEALALERTLVKLHLLVVKAVLVVHLNSVEAVTTLVVGPLPVIVVAEMSLRLKAAAGARAP